MADVCGDPRRATRPATQVAVEVRTAGHAARPQRASSPTARRRCRRSSEPRSRWHRPRAAGTVGGTRSRLARRDARQGLRHHPPRGRRARRRARRVGARLHPLAAARRAPPTPPSRPASPRRCGAASSSSACSSTRRSTRSRTPPRRSHLTHVQLHGDEGPAFCAEAGRRTGAKVIKAVRVGSGADLQDLERFHTRLPPARRRGARAARRHGRDVGLGARRAPPRARCRSILSGGLTAGERRRGRSPRSRPYAVDVASGVEAAPGRQGPRQAARLLRGGRRAPRPAAEACRVTAVEHRFGPYGGQYVPETLMPALAELEAAWIAARADPAYRAELDAPAARLLRPPDAALPRRAPVRGAPAGPCGSSART